MEFRAAVIAALDKILASGEVEKHIEAVLEKTIKSIIENELRQYSEFGKELEAKVIAALKIHDLGDLPSYNDTIVKIVRSKVAALTEDTIQRQVAANLEELLTPAPAEIKFSELVEQYREYLKSHVDAGCVSYGDYQMTLRVEREGGWTYIELSKEPNQRQYAGDIRFGLTQDSRIYTLAFKNKDIEKQLFVGPLRNFERSLFQMKAAGTKVIMDIDPDSISLDYSGVDI